jgi:hypothetical protein
MKINRMSDEKSVPNWIIENKSALKHLDKEATSKKETERVVSMPKELSEDAIIMEKDHIEQCASSKKPYHYNTQWADGVKSELKEYASVVGMDMKKFKAINPDNVTVDPVATVEVKAAAKVESKIKMDPFKLDSIENRDKTPTWEKVEGQSVMSDRPSMSSSVISVRNSDDYYKNSTPKTAKGKNSILDPEAIEKLAKSTVEDTGARLKRENEERVAQKEVNHKSWQTDKVAAMAQQEGLPNRGVVYATESMNAQPGIRGADAFDTSHMPEKTDGEQIKDVNAQRSSKREFKIEKPATMGISADFGNELKKLLGK